MFSLFDNNTEDNLLQKFLLTKIGNNTFAFKIEYIAEIIPAIEIFTIENLKNNIIGLINLLITIISNTYFKSRSNSFLI